MSKIDKRAVQQRLDRITEIFADMVRHADTQARERCPYRDRHDRCTAQFSCRNQSRGAEPEAPVVCTHDGRFDYRSAWETRPESRERAKRKLAEIRAAARKRRAAKSGAAEPE